MDTLDSTTPQTPNTPIWNTVLRYGLYLAGASIVFGLLIYLINFNMMTLGGAALYYGCLIAMSAVFAVMAIKYQRNQLDGGYISYGKALAIGALTIFAGTMIASLWGYVFVNFIDPGYLTTLKEMLEDTWGDQMTAEQLQEANKGFEKAGEIGASLWSGVKSGSISGLIIGLITAAFMKKQPQVSMR